MTKRDLVSRISNETGMVQMDVQKVVQLTLDCISEAVARGQKAARPRADRDFQPLIL